jgi:hypothetical protein
MDAGISEFVIGDTPYHLVYGWSEATHLARIGRTRAICGYDDMVDDDEATVPTCGRCLRIATKRLISSPLDDRIGLVASLVDEAVVGYGSALVFNVPGDQVEALRVAVRRQLHSRRLRCRSMVTSGVLAVWSDDAYNAIDPARKEELEQDANARIDAMYAARRNNEPLPPLEKTDRVDWNTWG